jgi:adenylate cyclase
MLMRTIRETLLGAAVMGETKGLSPSGRRFAEGAWVDAVDVLRLAARTRGRLMGVMSDRILVVYATPDSAAGAAADMADAVAALPPLAGIPLTARIAFHCGAVSATGDEETTQIVFRLLAQAKPGQILTTQETAELLGTSYRAFSSSLRAAPLAASGPRASIYEVLGRNAC